jgi:5'-deoxynucleotidase YfbR-like HD superfamily hydrolase
MIDRNLLRARLEFVRQGSEVERFHTKRMIQRNDVGHHSFHVAWLAYFMAVGDGVPYGSVVIAALAHDLAEHITGDVPGNFKRYMNLSEQYDAFEQTLFADVGLAHLNATLSEDEARIVHMADMMEGAFFAISEASLGNRRIGVVFNNYRAYMRKMEPFSETETMILEYIDELWGHYGRLLDSGQFLGNCPAWTSTDKEHSVDEGNVEVTYGSESIYPRESGLIGELRREEAESRATPPPCSHSMAKYNFKIARFECECGMVLGDPGLPWHRLSDAPAQEGGAVQEEPLSEPVDDSTQPDFVASSPTTSLANQHQHGGDHYKRTPYQHWDFVLDTDQSYLQGCASKYITRYKDHEDGVETNLNKAIHYCEKAQEAANEGRLKNTACCDPSRLAQYAEANRLDSLETEAIGYIIEGRWGAAREVARELLRKAAV